MKHTHRFAELTPETAAGSEDAWDGPSLDALSAGLRRVAAEDLAHAIPGGPLQALPALAAVRPSLTITWLTSGSPTLSVSLHLAGCVRLPGCFAALNDPRPRIAPGRPGPQ
jgi:hypothetical protein